MSKLKEIQRQATVSWSPITDQPDLIVSGTVAGTIGVDFDTSSHLEIFSLDITNDSPQMTLKGKTTSSNRFNKIAWGAASGNSPLGIIAGAMDNNTISLWNPAKILEGVEDESTLIGTANKHTGAVHSIDLHSVQTNLLASGGSDSEIFIWDLSNPTSPTGYTPGPKPQHSAEITSVAWNKKFQHILGSASNNGSVFVWDLKAKRSIINFGFKRCQYRSIVWNPLEATSIVSASEDDEHPVIQVWDLRNVNTPVKSLEGHKKGVWGLSWCPNDNSLLLSCGKDNKTLCWNVNTGEVLCEIESSHDPNAWNFEVQWSPRIPAMLSTSSFGDKVNIYSLQDVNERNTSGEPTMNALGFQEQPAKKPTLKHTPDWLQRPVGAAFGFGGKIVTFGKKKQSATSPQQKPEVVNQQRIVHISYISTEKELVESSEKLESVIKSGNYEEFCDEKISVSSSEEEKSTWGFLKVLFDKDGRQKILNYLGYDIEQTKTDLQKFLGTLPELPLSKEEPKPKEQDQSSSTSDDSKVDDLFKSSSSDNLEIPTEVTQFVETISKSPIQFPASGNEQMITRALMIGDYQSAVDCCLHLGRLSDALILASSAGPELWKKTQQAYFDIVKSPFTKVVSCIVRRDLETLVRTSDLADWKATLSVLCTYASTSNFRNLSGILGDRLDCEIEDTKSATLCYICAGDIDKTVSIWTRSQNKESNRDLQSLIEKVSIFRNACNSSSPLNDVLAAKYAKYAEILASQGNLTTSLRYLSLLNTPNYQESFGILIDRVYRSAPNNQGIHAPPFPFKVVDVFPSGNISGTGNNRPIGTTGVPGVVVDNRLNQNRPPTNVFNPMNPMNQPPPQMNPVHPPHPSHPPQMNQIPMNPMNPTPPPMNPIPMNPMNPTPPPPQMNPIPMNPMSTPPQMNPVHPPQMNPMNPPQMNPMNPPPPQMNPVHPPHPSHPPQMNPIPMNPMNPTPPPMNSMISSPPPMNTFTPMNPMNPTPQNMFSSPPPPSTASAGSPPPPPAGYKVSPTPRTPEHTSSELPQSTPKPNVHNTPPIQTPTTSEPLSQDSVGFIEKINNALVKLQSTQNKQAWEDANRRCQNLINKVSNRELTSEAFKAVEIVVNAVAEGDYKRASDLYLKITSTPFWNEIGSQSMIGLKRLIDIGLKFN
eukprot:gene9151-11217_t